MDRIRYDEIGDLVGIFAITFSFFGVSLIHLLFPMPPRFAVAFTGLLFAGSLFYVIPRFLRARQRLRRLKQGRAGEQAVAECLDLLRSAGAFTFHDVPGVGFNIDHVVVSRHGVFAVETKTISKPVGRDARITFDGEKVLVGRYEPSRNPVKQARAQAAWLKRLIEEATGVQANVRPVVTFPGWFVQGTQLRDRTSPWVLEPKALVQFVQNEPECLTEPQVKLVTHFLKRHIRAENSAAAA